MVTQSDQQFATLDRYHDAYGVIRFTLWEDFDPRRDEEREIIIAHFEQIGCKSTEGDKAFLNRLTPSLLDKSAFLGRWFDSKRAKLLEFGRSRRSSADEEQPLTVEQYESSGLRSGSWEPPDAGDRGEFAYAFYRTPYGLRGSRSEIQAMFDKLWSVLSPAHADCRYFDWSDPELKQHFRPYYEAGAEWWGTFLFTIHNATDRRLWVMTASTTD